MEAHPFTFIILLTTISNFLIIQGLVATNLKDEKLTLEKQLEIINKPATKSFVTKYGDILDCVEINKQPAFDHPLLKNHSIQVKPSDTINVSKSPKIIGRSQFLPKHMRCPKGTVPIRRMQKEDLKSSTLLDKPSFYASNHVSNDGAGHEVAGVVGFRKNLGASGSIDVWNPHVNVNQYSATCVYVGSEDGPVSNVIQTGWMVNPWVYANSTQTRFYGYWTKDDGKSTGCYDTKCPGFVQVSTKVYLGQVISPVSTRLGHQYFIDVEIRQDIRSKNWWQYYNGEPVGYWPKELFTTMTSGATRAGWGGEIYKPPTDPPPYPDMGSGYQADAVGWSRICLMKNMNMLAPEFFPPPQDVKILLSKPDTYTIIHEIFKDDWGNHIFFGGPKKDY